LFAFGGANLRWQADEAKIESEPGPEQFSISVVIKSLKPVSMWRRII